MGKIRMRSASISENPQLNAPKFHFSQYEVGRTYNNNDEIIDFVTDGNSLYVCQVNAVTTSHENLADQEGFLKLVSQGPQGIRGPRGNDGDSAVAPRIDVNFDDDQLRIKVNGETKALSPSLTGPTWKPVLEDNILTWELTDDRYMPESIDLMNLRPIQEHPILLRTNSDNTKRSDESSGPANFIQWKYEGDEYWTNLISISELMNLTLAGVSIWQNSEGKWHFGHKEVVKANYISDKNGRKIISNVRLGDVLFDAGELPFAESDGGNDYGTDIDLIWQKLAELEAAMVKTVNHEGPDQDGNVDVETGSDVSLDGYATENWVSSNYQPKGNYVKKVTVNGNSYTPNASTGEVDLGNIGGNGGNVDTSDCVKSVTINNITQTPDSNNNGHLVFSIEAGNLTSFDVRFDTSTRKLQKTTDGQTWIDLVDLDDYTGGTGGGISESDVKHLIGQILEGVLDSAIPEYVKGADHDYFIRKSGLANYTTVNDVAAMIRDAMTGQNIDYYRVFTLYQRTNSPTVPPAKPVVGVWEWNTAANEDTIALKANAQSAWNNHPANATVTDPYLWITSATYSYLTKSEINTGTQENPQNPWETPICLTAQDGQDGVDGDSVEFMYILCTDTEFNNIKNTTPVPEHGDNRPDDLPTYTTPSGNGWTDHPSGISETYQIEAVSIRTKDDGTWSSYSNPTIWSMWGEDGMDGDGVEYIFAVATENETAIDAQTGKRELNASFFRGQSATQILPLTDQEVTTLGTSYQISDWCPDGTTKQGYLMPDLNWTDNPSDVGPDQPYEFVAIRKKKLDPVSGQMKWGPFSTPALWGFWGQKTVTVIESGSVYRHPYTCFAFTRSATDITGYTVVNPWTYNNITYAAWIAADNTREEGYYSNPLSYVVTLDDNNQVVSSANLTWSDTVPAPPGQLYMITNHIGDEASGNDQGWTSPRAWGDASGFQVEYANSSTATDNVYNRVTTLPRLDNYDLDNYPNLNDPDNDGIDEAAWRTAVQTAGMGVWGDENDITYPDYMATCYKKQEGVWSNWQISRIKGERGDDSDIPGPAGKDGTDIEFVYFRTDAEDHRPGMSDTYGTYDGQTKISEDLYEDDFFPMATGAFLSDPNITKDTELHIGNDLFWHDHPAGVTEQLPCEWVGMRHSSYDLQGDKVWGEFNIALWSKYGANGRDGDGIEYVFWGLSKQDVQQITSTWPTQQASNNINNGANVDDPNDRRPDKNGKFITDNEYLPAILINNVGREAVDNNPGIENNEYVYASMRRFNGSSHTWGEFGEIKLWNEQNNQDLYSVVLDIEDDTHPVFVDEDGRVTDRRMSYTYSTDNMYLYKDLVLIGNGDVYIVNSNNADIKIAELIPDSQQSNCYNLITSSNGIPVSSNGITAKVYPTYAWKYENSNSSKVELKVVFDQVSNENPILTNSFDITIKVKSADGNYTGSDLLRLVPKYVEKEVELLSVPGTQRTAEEGGKTYSDSEFRFSGWYGDVYTPLSLVADTTFYFKYDDQANWTKFKIPVNNSYLATLKNTIDGITEGDGYFYFDRTGTLISAGANNTHVNGEFFRIWLYNTDYKDNNHGTWTNWNIIAYVHTSAFTATEDYPVDELYFGIGFDGNEPIDEANVHIIYPGKNGQPGVNGSYKKELYCLGTENDYDGKWQASYVSPGATISALTSSPNAWVEMKPTVTSSKPHIWMTRADVTIGAEATQTCIWEEPIRITHVDGTVTMQHTYQYLDGQVMRLSNWVSNSGTNCWNGATRVGSNNQATGSQTEGTYYLDVVSYNGDYYKCVSNTTMGSTTPDNDTTGTGHHWELFSVANDQTMANLLVSNSAFINSLTSHQIVVTDSDNTIVGGMTSQNSNDDESISEGQNNSHDVGDVRIWAGAVGNNGDLADAPFTVTNNGIVTSQGSVTVNNVNVPLKTVMSNGLISIYANNLLKAAFGYKNNSIVLEFYDSNGDPIYNLGPDGIMKGSYLFTPAKWDIIYAYYSSTPFTTSGTIDQNPLVTIYKYEDSYRLVEPTSGSTFYAIQYTDPFENGGYSGSHSILNEKYFSGIATLNTSNYNNLYAADGYYMLPPGSVEDDNSMESGGIGTGVNTNVDAQVIQISKNTSVTPNTQTVTNHVAHLTMIDDNGEIKYQYNYMD